MENKDIIGKTPKTKVKKQKEIGIDTTNSLMDTLVDGIFTSTINSSDLSKFTSATRTRDIIYKNIDVMGEDSTLSSVLDAYTSEITEPNDSGQVVWVESSDKDIIKYVENLLDSIEVDKHIYEWAYNLVKYGDVYLKLFRESDYEDDILFNKDKKSTLNEKINLNIAKKTDKYVHYVEMVKNPAEIFELTKHGKTVGYIKAPIESVSSSGMSELNNLMLQYNLKDTDVDVYQATDFVHACRPDTSSRVAEEINISIDDNKKLTYQVRKGQSLFFNVFKVWRELSLLENSVLLNRVSKSSILRLIQVEVGDQPKEQVQKIMMRIKSLVEQKTSFRVDEKTGEYTNPGPIENNVYVPTHQGVGAITSSEIGGDVDPKQLTDLDWYNNKLFGALRAPKQFFSFTDDAAGFSGGQSLSIISSGFGKLVTRYQQFLIWMITDLINLYCIDAGLTNYINNFKIKMQPPITQEELDKRDNVSNRIRVIGDIMGTLSDITETKLRLEILKELLANVIEDNDIIMKIQEQIDLLDNEETNEEEHEETNRELPKIDKRDLDLDKPIEDSEEEQELDNEIEETEEEIEQEENDSYLPTPDELGIDMSSNI